MCPRTAGWAGALVVRWWEASNGKSNAAIVSLDKSTTKGSSFTLVLIDACVVDGLGDVDHDCPAAAFVVVLVPEVGVYFVVAAVVAAVVTAAATVEGEVKVDADMPLKGITVVEAVVAIVLVEGLDVNRT